MCTVLFIRAHGVFWTSQSMCVCVCVSTQMRINTHAHCKDTLKELTVSTFIFHWINKPVKGKHEPHLQKSTAWGYCIHEVKTSKKQLILIISYRFLTNYKQCYWTYTWYALMNKTENEWKMFFSSGRAQAIYKHPQSALHLQQISLTKKKYEAIKLALHAFNRSPLSTCACVWLKSNHRAKCSPVQTAHSGVYTFIKVLWEGREHNFTSPTYSLRFYTASPLARDESCFAKKKIEKWM